MGEKKQKKRSKCKVDVFFFQQSHVRKHFFFLGFGNFFFLFLFFDEFEIQKPTKTKLVIFFKKLKELGNVSSFFNLHFILVHFLSSFTKWKIHDHSFLNMIFFCFFLTLFWMLLTWKPNNLWITNGTVTKKRKINNHKTYFCFYFYVIFISKSCSIHKFQCCSFMDVWSM